VLAALIGAGGAFLFALLLSLSGHSSWYFLAMLVGAIAPGLIFSFVHRPKLEAVRQACQNLPAAIRYGLILAMIAAALGAKWALDAGGYGLLLIPVVASAALFGFGPALFTVAASTAVADYFFAQPAFSLVVTEWDDAFGLAAFAILGAFAALLVDEALNLDEVPR